MYQALEAGSLFPKHPMLFGHRGCSKAAPENTIPAFEKILQHRIPGVELDVRRCKSGELVLTHDSNLLRVTGLDALVTEVDFQTIRSLDCGSWFSPDYAGERIPLLDDVLDLLGGKVIIDIEIKHWERECGEMERMVAEIIRKRNLQDSVMISSFNPWALKAVRSADPGIILALIYTDYKEFPNWLSRGAGRYLSRPELLKPNRLKVNEELILQEHTYRGYPLVTWTEDDPKVIRHFLDIGINGVITNVPETVLPIFEERWG